MLLVNAIMLESSGLTTTAVLNHPIVALTKQLQSDTSDKKLEEFTKAKNTVPLPSQGNLP